MSVVGSVGNPAIEQLKQSRGDDDRNSAEPESTPISEIFKQAVIQKKQVRITLKERYIDPFTSRFNDGQLNSTGPHRNSHPTDEGAKRGSLMDSLSSFVRRKTIPLPNSTSQYERTIAFDETKKEGLFPIDVTEAIGQLKNQPWPTLNKLLFWKAYYSSEKKLLKEIQKFLQSKKSPYESKRIRHHFPRLKKISSEPKENSKEAEFLLKQMIIKESEIKGKLRLILDSALEICGDKPFTFLSSINEKYLNETENKAIRSIVLFLYNKKPIVIQKLLQSQLSLDNKISYLAQFLNVLVEAKEESIEEIWKSLLVLFKKEQCGWEESKSQVLVKLDEEHLKFSTNSQHIYSKYAVELLLAHVDPKGTGQLNWIWKNENLTLAQQCAKIGKVQFLLENTETTINQDFCKLRKQFIQKWQEMIAKSEVNSAGIDDLLRNFGARPLTKKEINFIALKFHDKMVSFFIEFDRRAFESGNWQSSQSWKNYQHFLNQIQVFIGHHVGKQIEDANYSNTRMGELVKTIGIILNNWRSVSYTLARNGELNLAFAIFNASESVWLRSAEDALPQVKQLEQQGKLTTELQDFFNELFKKVSKATMELKSYQKVATLFDAKHGFENASKFLSQYKINKTPTIPFLTLQIKLSGQSVESSGLQKMDMKTDAEEIVLDIFGQTEKKTELIDLVVQMLKQPIESADFQELKKEMENLLEKFDQSIDMENKLKKLVETLSSKRKIANNKRKLEENKRKQASNKLFIHQNGLKIWDIINQKNNSPSFFEKIESTTIF